MSGLAAHPWDQAANEIFAGAQTVEEAVRLRDAAVIAQLRRRLDDLDRRMARHQDEIDRAEEDAAAVRAQLVVLGVDPDALL